MKLARACVALAAAYALALQVLLASVAAAGAAMAPQAPGVVICYGDGDNANGNQPSHSPAHFADCVLACAQGLGAAAILPPDISSAPVSTMGRPLDQAAAIDFILSPPPSPKLAQGPPRNA
jgi:hypothetical protein